MKRAVFPIVVVLCTVTSIVAAFLAGRTAIPNTLYATQADLHLGESFQGQTPKGSS